MLELVDDVKTCMGLNIEDRSCENIMNGLVGEVSIIVQQIRMIDSVTTAAKNVLRFICRSRVSSCLFRNTAPHLAASLFTVGRRVEELKQHPRSCVQEERETDGDQSTR